MDNNKSNEKKKHDDSSEIASIYTFQSRDSRILEDNSSTYVAISPDGELAATFNSGRTLNDHDSFFFSSLNFFLFFRLI